MVPICFLIFLLSDHLSAIPVVNGVEGDPEIECGSNQIVVNVNTQNQFEGHVYVKFLTKVDRVYRIQCFYMEADKTVSTEIEVSMLTTGLQTHLVSMPVCRYQLLEGGPTGQSVQFALVGDPVYHKWICDTETVNTFCMVVHTCFVDDGNDDKVNLLDSDGCALDKYLLNNLEYPTDLMAGQEAHVFKYADRPQLFFQCQITITVKEPDEGCLLPQCPEPEGRGGKRKREVALFGDTLDVQSQHLYLLDIDDNVNTVEFGCNGIFL